MTPKRGDVWLANLNPIRGFEQAGIRPVLIFQNYSLNKVTSTFLAIHSQATYDAPHCLLASELHKAMADWQMIQLRSVTT